MYVGGIQNGILKLVVIIQTKVNKNAIGNLYNMIFNENLIINTRPRLYHPSFKYDSIINL